MTVSIYNRQTAAAFILSVYAALGIGTGAYAAYMQTTMGLPPTPPIPGNGGKNPPDKPPGKLPLPSMQPGIQYMQTPPPRGPFVPGTQNVQGSNMPPQYSPAAIQNDLQLVKQGQMTRAAFQQKLQQAVAGAKQNGTTLPSNVVDVQNRSFTWSVNGKPTHCIKFEIIKDNEPKSVTTKLVQ